jgi:hypothetical protein
MLMTEGELWYQKGPLSVALGDDRVENLQMAAVSKATMVNSGEIRVSVIEWLIWGTMRVGF